MKIVYNRFIPFGKRFLAINIFGVLFAKGKCGPQTINHERIHTAQIRELAFIFFYILYLLEWIVRLLQFRNFYTAYENISFEREAYANQGNPDYLKQRSHYMFLKHLRKSGKKRNQPRS